MDAYDDQETLKSSYEIRPFDLDKTKRSRIIVLKSETSAEDVGVKIPKVDHVKIYSDAI